MKMFQKHFLAIIFIILLHSTLFAGGRPSSFSSRPSSFSSRPSSFSSRPSSFSSKPSSFSSKPSSFSSKPSSFSGKSTTFGGTRNTFSGKSTFSGGSHNDFNLPKTFTNKTPIPDKQYTRIIHKPLTINFDKLAVSDSRKAQSRQNYRRSNDPIPEYQTPLGTKSKINPNDKKIKSLRDKLNDTSWVNRPTRESTFYKKYSSNPPLTYNDPYHQFWNYWLLSQTIDNMAMWTYCHKHDMDPKRLDYLYSQNSELKKRIADLESKKTPIDPNWTPKGTEYDLQYNDNYINAVINPQPKLSTEYEYEYDQIDWFAIIITIFCIVIIVAMFLVVC